jgi:hypothetical protein
MDIVYIDKCRYEIRVQKEVPILYTGIYPEHCVEQETWGKNVWACLILNISTSQSSPVNFFFLWYKRTVNILCLCS